MSVWGEDNVFYCNAGHKMGDYMGYIVTVKTHKVLRCTNMHNIVVRSQVQKLMYSNDQTFAAHILLS